MKLSRYIIIIFVAIFTISSVAKEGSKEDSKEMKIILMIDDSLAKESRLKEFSLFVGDKSISVKYDFGRVFISNEDYEMIERDEDAKLRFEFSYLNSCKDEYQKYEVNIPKVFFLSSNLVINVFNVFKKDNSENYYFGDKNYLVKFESGSYSSLLIHKK